MRRVEIVRRPTPAERASSRRLRRRAHRRARRPAAQRPPVARPARGGDDGHVAVAVLEPGTADRVLALAQVSAANDGFGARAGRRRPGIATTRCGRRRCSTPRSTPSPATAAAGSPGGSICTRDADDDAIRALAAQHGLRPARALHEMRRPLPHPTTPTISHTVVRARGRRRGLAGRQQPGLRRATASRAAGPATRSRQRLAEPWFDPDGFLLHEIDGTIAAVLLDEDPHASTRRRSARSTSSPSTRLPRAAASAGSSPWPGSTRSADRGIAHRASSTSTPTTPPPSAVRRSSASRSTGPAPPSRAHWEHHDRHRRPRQRSRRRPTPSRSPAGASPTCYESLDSPDRSSTPWSASAPTSTRLAALFDEHDVRAIEPRPVTAADGVAADAVIAALQPHGRRRCDIVGRHVYATVTTDSPRRAGRARCSASSTSTTPRSGRCSPASPTGSTRSAPTSWRRVSEQAREHHGPLRRLAERPAHQMSEAEEGLYAELPTTGSSAWDRLHRDVTSQLATDVAFPDGTTERLPMPAVRGLATHPTPAVREAAYDAEMAAWPHGRHPDRRRDERDQGRGRTSSTAAATGTPRSTRRCTPTASAGRRSTRCSRRSSTRSPTSAAGCAPRPTRARPRRRRCAWWRPDGAAPAGVRVDLVGRRPRLGRARRSRATAPSSAGLVDRALDERWIDAGPRDGKAGGAFCMPFVERPLARAAQLVGQRRLGPDHGPRARPRLPQHHAGRSHAAPAATCRWRSPRRPASSARRSSSRPGCTHLDGAERLALLDVDLAGSNQVVVDIHRRFLFETEVFARRQRRTLGVAELERADAAGPGRRLRRRARPADTRHPYMWVLKPHYYGSHFYNWPYTYGLLFGLGLFAQYQDDPERFRAGYDDALSRAGIDYGRGARRGVRPRRHRRGVLGRQPRRRAATASPSTRRSPPTAGLSARPP